MIGLRSQPRSIFVEADPLITFSVGPTCLSPLLSSVSRVNVLFKLPLPMNLLNINTKEYWENRYSSGEWSERGGNSQTRIFAETQVEYIEIDPHFSGSICDFGCGEGDAMPVYHKKWPRASLFGCDISPAAIVTCTNRYGQFASFNSSIFNVGRYDYIISSNTFEHLDDDLAVARALLLNCRKLFIIVPFREFIPLGSPGEHIRSYDHGHFSSIGRVKELVFRSKGWGLHGFDLLFNGYFKNVARCMMRRRLVGRSFQILYTISAFD